MNIEALQWTDPQSKESKHLCKQNFETSLIKRLMKKYTAYISLNICIIKRNLPM
jgi:hypothetical protein